MIIIPRKTLWQGVRSRIDQFLLGKDGKLLSRTHLTPRLSGGRIPHGCSACCINYGTSDTPRTKGIRTVFSGINTGVCDTCVVGAGNTRVRYNSLAVDGTYDTPIRSTGWAFDSPRRGPTLWAVADIYHYSVDCAAPTSSCNLEYAAISISYDCNVASFHADGRALITAVSFTIVRGAGTVWDSETTCFDPYNGDTITSGYAFYYERTLHGGTYYHDDVIPNGLATCDDDPGGTHVASTTGSVVVSDQP